jgi:hypothetical protein
VHVDGIFLVDKGFACFLLELVRNFPNIVGNFTLFHSYYSSNPWRIIREYNLHQFYHSCSWTSHFLKVARRSKRPYTFLDLPCLICLP